MAHCCEHPQLERLRIIHHLPCSNAHMEMAFKQLDGSLRCPKCHTALFREGFDYDYPGIVDICHHCGIVSSPP